MQKLYASVALSNLENGNSLVVVQFLIEQSEVVFFSELRVEPTRFVRIIDGSLYAYVKPTYPVYHVS